MSSDMKNIKIRKVPPTKVHRIYWWDDQTMGLCPTEDMARKYLKWINFKHLSDDSIAIGLVMRLAIDNRLPKGKKVGNKVFALLFPRQRKGHDTDLHANDHKVDAE